MVKERITTIEELVKAKWYLDYLIKELRELYKKACDNGFKVITLSEYLKRVLNQLTITSPRAVGL